jgi:hypothetical protein
MFATGLYGARGHTVAKVEATNSEATEGWTDVTEEFRNPAGKELPRCNRHRAYSGSRKPGYRWYADKACTCWKIYSQLHPDYPEHNGWCDEQASDPKHCGCRMITKIFGQPGMNQEVPRLYTATHQVLVPRW